MATVSAIIASRGALRIPLPTRSVKPNGQHLIPTGGKGQQRTSKAGQRIAEDYKNLSLAAAVTEISGKEFEQT